ncbi:ribonuclease H1 domain-containing protein [Clostridium weizhouense]|uniref:Ribonuclease H family protein n=1 Tax=Clostridium weizhouense TaxID=2859781 RepID=A0ABS7AJ41_9CLOT|nr:ribonuclease H family protein [Clostridium weizhouense]MBW6408652.1 ribonuclease H family protein [Clostridium weizhouense]
MGKKVYAIKEGFDSKNNLKVENKIVNTWAECLSYVKGVKGAKYKSFENIDEAKKFLNDSGDLLKKEDKNYPEDCLHIYVDGSYNMDTQEYSYGIVAVKNNIVEYIDSGIGKNDSDKNIRQIAGELKAAIEGVKYALKNNEKKVVIFHDYAGICYHATGFWERKEESSKKYYDSMQEFMNNGIEIIFVKVDSHTGDFFNELVDEKCKEVLFIKSDKVVEKWLKKNQLKVSDISLKNQILTIAANCEENIVVINNVDLKINKKEDIQSDFEYIIKSYNDNKSQGKKLISKLLSKEKEKFILYLLEK